MGDLNVDNVFSGYILCHGADPQNAAKQAAKPGDGTPSIDGAIDRFEADYRIRNWLSQADENVAGLDAAALDLTTIQRWTDEAKGDPYGTNDIAAFGALLRADPQPWSHARPIWEWFAGPFRYSVPARGSQHLFPKCKRSFFAEMRGSHQRRIPYPSA